MTGLEWENFEKLDRKEYIVDKNNEFLKYYYDKITKGYSPILNLGEIQELIDNITKFYEFKYPENLLNAMRHERISDKEEFQKCIKIGKKLDINQLKYRLSHDQLSFIECNYGHHITLERNKKKLFEFSLCYLRIDSNGIIEKHDLERLQEEKFIDDIEGINRVEDLLGRYIGIETNVNYSELEKLVENHRDNIAVRNKVLELVMLNLLYSKNTHPKNGYIRAKRFMRMFNKEYGLDLNMEKLDEIMSVDYSDGNKVKQLLRDRRRK